MTYALNLAHPLLPLPHPPQARCRQSRRPFTPSSAGVYRLPHDVRDRLAVALAPYHNRDLAFALAVFLGRFWSPPARLLSAFPIDRRELADHAALGLTEARVRGAIKVLEEVGFLDRAVRSGSTHQPTPDGLHRKPVLFMFGSEYGPLFNAANRRAAAARDRRSRSRRGFALPARNQRSTAALSARPSRQNGDTARLANSPKSKGREAEKMIMGEIRPKPPQSPLQNSALNAALDRWKLAFEKARATG